MKRYIPLILALCLLSFLFLPGCKPEEVDERQLSVFDLHLSNEMKQELLVAFAEMDGSNTQYSLEDWGDPEGTLSRYDHRYYGTFDGSIVWAYCLNADHPGGTTAFNYFYIEYGPNERLLLYKDGICYDLFDAYNLISLKDLEIVAKRHYEYNDAVDEYESTMEGLQ